MKNHLKIRLCLLALVLCILAAACKSDKTLRVIPGTYIHVKHKNGKTINDTLTLRPALPDEFVLEQHSGYTVYRKGQKSRRIYKKFSSLYVYNALEQCLTERSEAYWRLYYPPPILNHGGSPSDISLRPDSAYLIFNGKKYLKR